MKRSEMIEKILEVLIGSGAHFYGNRQETAEEILITMLNNGMRPSTRFVTIKGKRCSSMTFEPEETLEEKESEK